MRKSPFTNILFMGLVFFCLTKPAYAYLDPGTGSYLYQLLLAGLFGGMFFMSTHVKEIIKKFKRKTNTEKKSHR